MPHEEDSPLGPYHSCARGHVFHSLHLGKLDEQDFLAF